MDLIGSLLRREGVTCFKSPAQPGPYNDYVPLIYGTGWFEPPVVLARNDGNLTHFEVLLGAGEIAGVETVIVNNIESPGRHFRKKHDGDRLV